MLTRSTAYLRRQRYGRAGAAGPNPAQLAAQVGRALPARCRILCQATLYHMLKGQRDQRLHLGERLRILLQNRRRDRDLALALECTPARDHFIKYCAKTKNVTAPVRFLPL